MYSYTLMQWLFLFYFYCFFGWCFESAYVSLKKKKLVNRGFMRGPFLPLYGSGAIMMLLVSSPFQENIVMVYVAGCIGATILELVTGVMMEALFKVRYWDYSNLPLNYKGHICLGSSLAWGFLTILMTEVIHKPVEKVMMILPSVMLVTMTVFLTLLVFIDFVLSFKAALDLRDILVRMERTKEELVRVQRRLDVLIAIADSEIEAKKAAFSESLEQTKEALTERLDHLHIEEIKENLGERLRIDRLKESIEERLQILKGKPSDYLESVKEEIAELRQKYRENMEKKVKLGGIRNFYKRNMIRSNPTMRSVKFKDSFEELKEYIEKRKNKDNEKNENSLDK